MYTDKPSMDRQKVLREERARSATRQLLDQLNALLGKGECLGTPTREGDALRIPIERAPNKTEAAQ